MNLIQNNDQEIQCPITFKGEPINAAGLLSAEYKLFSVTNKTALLEKALSSGVEVGGSNVLVIEITHDDCKSLRGTYYHELTIEDPIEGRSTVFKQNITFEPTRS